MKKLVVEIEVANVLVLAVANALERRDAVADGEVLMKGLRSPVRRRRRLDDGLETASLVSLGHIDACPIQERRRQVHVERRRVDHFSLLRVWYARIANDHRNTERFFVVRPFTREPRLPMW